jgi:anti-anti-sigma factor
MAQTHDAPDPERRVFFDVAGSRLVVRGECDCDNAGELARRLDDLGRVFVELDLSDVTFFDSASLRVVLTAYRDNPKLRVVNPSRQVRRVLEITDTLQVLCDE